jgi:hypothetical protein
MGNCLRCEKLILHSLLHSSPFDNLLTDQLLIYVSLLAGLGLRSKRWVGLLRLLERREGPLELLDGRC